MRGRVNTRAHLFSYFSPEKRVPQKHPLRSIKEYADSALKQIRLVLDGIYSQIGKNVRIIGCAIGRNCVIGANSVVTASILDYCVAIGAPAALVKRYCTTPEAMTENGWVQWVHRAEIARGP